MVNHETVDLNITSSVAKVAQLYARSTSLSVSPIVATILLHRTSQLPTRTLKPTAPPMTVV